jgi:hypothetical protein
VGVLVTKSLVIAGEPGISSTDEHPRGAMLRAYDKATGAEVRAVFMEAPQTGSPMTYVINGNTFFLRSAEGTLLLSSSPMSCRTRRSQWTPNSVSGFGVGGTLEPTFEFE